MRELSTWIITYTHIHTYKHMAFLCFLLSDGGEKGLVTFFVLQNIKISDSND